MCGIVGAVGSRNIVPVLVECLKRLEYRGYDSCGVAVLQDGQLRRSRSSSWFSMMPLCTTANSSPEKCGWALRSLGAPWVAQRVLAIPS